MPKKKVNDVTKESNKATFKELFNRIECDTGLIFVDTPEETRLIREIYKEYSNQSVQFWSIRFGLHIIDANMTEIPDEFMPHDYHPGSARKGKDPRIDSRNSLLDALAVIEEDCREKLDPNKLPAYKNIYILRDPDKYFQNPAVVRAVRDLIYMASCSASTIIMVGFGIQIHNDLIKDAVYLKISYPTKDEIKKNIIPLVKNQISEHNKKNTKKELQINPCFDEEEVVRACAGLTEDQILNVLQYTTTVDNKINIDRILEEKRSIINKSDILEYWICDTNLSDVGGFGQLKQWFSTRKVVMTSPHAKTFKAKSPKGIMLLGVQGSGKAMPLYSKVLMEDKTFKELGYIEVGDVVRTPNGKTAKVINIFEHKNKDNFRTRFSDGRNVESCDEHLWKIYNKNFKSGKFPDGWKVVDTKEIIRLLNQEDETKRFYIPLLTDSQESVQLPIDSYILGVLLGDESFRYNVQFSNNDQELVDKVKSHLISWYHVHSHNTHSLNEHRIAKYINDDHTINVYKQELMKMGLWGLTSKEKFIPEYYFTAPLYQKISLIQGLIDADGSTDNSLSVSTSSDRLAKNIQRLIWSIGGISTISNRTTTCNGKPFSSFRVNIRYRDPKELVFLTRKKDKLSSNYQYADLKLEIKSVEYLGKEDMRCIMLDSEEHLYITDNYIVTHNTYIAKSVAADLGMGLIKLEMGKVFAGLVGESEKRMRQALAQIDAAGGVVMVDEIDKGLSGAGSSDKTDGGTTSRVIGTLLTWLQEPHPGVFLIATANDISALLNNHPELLRKGRFDEIWFSDLPTQEEREEIFKIHLRLLDRDPTKFNVKALSEVRYFDEETGRDHDYTGAEIEYAVNDGVTETFALGGGKELKIGGADDVTTEFIAEKLRLIKPMAKVAYEPINKMRRWASNNARNVSLLATPVSKPKTPTGGGKRRNPVSLRGKSASVDCKL